ncbi:MAG: GDP-mannose 4,6-dehydratase, partial [Acidobacteria bacterium]|nr:GDP-mannose 4,6-dehydratase [Acidobacteriota bacterium]
MRTVLITGGAGFMGADVVGYLYRKYPDYRILVLDLLTYAGNLSSIPEAIKQDHRFSFWYGSIKNSQLVDELVSHSNVVVHMAAESHVARSIFDNAICYDTNVMGTQVVANSVLKHRKTVERLVHISTSEVYGTALSAPMNEEHPLNALTPYASAKAGADRLVFSYWATYDIPAVIIRPFNNYGPHQHLEKV